MENNQSKPNWQLVKEYLKEQITKAEDQRGLGDEQRAIIKSMILEPLEKADQKSWEGATFPFIAFLMVRWVKLGFLPSQFEPLCHKPGLELTATFFRLFPRIKATNAPSPSGVSQFWDGIICEAMYDWADAKNAFDLCLNDPSIPSWIRVSALQLKAWHHLRLQEYNAARETFQQLRHNLRVSKPTVEYLTGYIKALEDSGLGSQYYELHHDNIFMMVQEAAPDESHFLPEGATRTEVFAGGVTLTESTIETLKSAITERIEPRLLLGIWQAKEEIIRSMPITHTLEEVGQRLRTEYGDWVSKLTNQGALTNAEFLYKALSTKSWGGVMIEYANAVEAEIKLKLLPGLESCLMKKGIVLENILPSKVKTGGSSLGYAEAVLRKIARTPNLAKLLSPLPQDTVSFLFNELPRSLAKLRELRRPPAHGDITIASDAREMRRRVLGTPQKPGLLKRLTEISIPCTG